MPPLQMFRTIGFDGNRLLADVCVVSLPTVEATDSRLDVWSSASISFACSADAT